jgi:hypothetical protein
MQLGPDIFLSTAFLNMLNSAYDLPSIPETKFCIFSSFFTFFYNKRRQKFLDGFEAGIPTLFTSMRIKF